MTTKVCSKCKIEKELSCFSLKNKEKQLYNSWCKDCRNQYDRDNYTNKNKNRKRELVNARKQSNRDFVNQYKAERGCAKCGDKRFYVLDFHHTSNDKENCVSLMMDYGLERILEEISKCEILCANCHREEHYKNNLPIG